MNKYTIIQLELVETLFINVSFYISISEEIIAMFTFSLTAASILSQFYDSQQSKQCIFYNIFHIHTFILTQFFADVAMGAADVVDNALF